MIALMLAARTTLPASTPAALNPTATVTAIGAIAPTQARARIKYFAGRGNRARVKPQRLGDLRTGHRVAAQPGEQLDLDCRQERLRRPEPHADPQDL
jgi:hypothetical protein